MEKSFTLGRKTNKTVCVWPKWVLYPSPLAGGALTFGEVNQDFAIKYQQYRGFISTWERPLLLLLSGRAAQLQETRIIILRIIISTQQCETCISRWNKFFQVIRKLVSCAPYPSWKIVGNPYDDNVPGNYFMPHEQRKALRSLISTTLQSKLCTLPSGQSIKLFLISRFN